MTATGPREVLFEFTVIGAVVKVAAIDATTGIEVSVMGPAHASRADLQKLALAKLNVRLATHSRS
jgi:YbbR domain-containing protein